MQIGFVGLGKMGANMVARVRERSDVSVVAWDLQPSALEDARQAGVQVESSPEALVKALRPPRAIWMMVPAGAAVDETIARLQPHLSSGDVLVDGGNTHYKDTVRRAEQLRQVGVELLDAGTSGGIWGRERGFCLMVGGSKQAFAHVEPVLKALAPPNGYAHVGRHGAGHFAKMVHNAIEYAVMQGYAEGFALLEGSGFELDLRQLADLWNQGSVIRSWLLELAARALKDDPTLQKVAAFVQDTGEGRWSVEAALERAIPIPVIAQSLFARFRSRQSNNFADRVLATLRNQFGGHAVKAAERTTP